jgi:sec-independent protein translocase protein TatA
MPNVGSTEIVIIVVIALLVFGPKRLPELGRSLGRGMREFKDSISGNGHLDERVSAAGPTERAHVRTQTVREHVRVEPSPVDRLPGNARDSPPDSSGAQRGARPSRSG